MFLRVKEIWQIILEQSSQPAFNEWVSDEPFILREVRQELSQLESLDWKLLPLSSITHLLKCALKYYHFSMCNVIQKGWEAQLWQLSIFSLSGLLSLYLIQYRLWASAVRDTYGRAVHICFTLIAVKLPSQRMEEAPKPWRPLLQHARWGANGTQQNKSCAYPLNKQSHLY